MVSNSEKVINSPYDVNLEYALKTRRNEDDEELATGPGIPHC